MEKKDSLSDERLVFLHQQKRINAFFIIYNRYQNYGTAIIYRTLDKSNLFNALKEEKDAIFYDSVMEALARYDQKRGTFRKLLSAILTNMTINYIRQFKKDPLSDYVSIDANLQENGTLVFADSLAVVDKEASPQDTINIIEDHKKVIVNYDGVHKRRIKRIIDLKREGYSYLEIARKIKTTEKAVRGVLYRIKKRIDMKDNNKIKK